MMSLRSARAGAVPRSPHGTLPRDPSILSSTGLLVCLLRLLRLEQQPRLVFGVRRWVVLGELEREIRRALVDLELGYEVDRRGPLFPMQVPFGPPSRFPTVPNILPRNTGTFRSDPILCSASLSRGSAHWSTAGQPMVAHLGPHNRVGPV